MQRVIYADVLVIINIYVTYFILRSSALLARINPDRIRMFFASLFGGIYSLTVLLPEKVQSIIGVARLGAAVIMVFVAFGFTSLRGFLRLNLSFLFCSFVFAGLMFAVWYFITPAGMYFNGSVVYFDIEILTLVLLTIACYVFLKIFDRLFRTRAPVNTVFMLKIILEGNEYELKAFLDTGNSLKDYFTGKPVIIADREIFLNEFPDGFEFECDVYSRKIRYILCDTIVGKDLLPSFSPENVHIKGTDYDFFTDEVTVALTDKKLLQGEYDAILPLSLFDNNFDRKDERESEKAYITSADNQSKDS